MTRSGRSTRRSTTSSASSRSSRSSSGSASSCRIVTGLREPRLREVGGLLGARHRCDRGRAIGRADDRRTPRLPRPAGADRRHRPQRTAGRAQARSSIRSTGSRSSASSTPRRRRLRDEVARRAGRGRRGGASRRSSSGSASTASCSASRARLERQMLRARAAPAGAGRAGGHRAAAVRGARTERERDPDRGDAAREPAADADEPRRAALEARVRRRRLARCCSCSLSPVVRGDRRLDQARLAGARALPADHGSASTSGRSRLSSSARCGRTRRPTSIATYVQRAMNSDATPEESGLYKLERPDVVTRSGPAPAQDEPRRAAAALERPARRHVARRAATVHPLRDGAIRAAPLRALLRSGRHHRPLAGEGPGALDASARRSSSTCSTRGAGRSGATSCCCSRRRCRSSARRRPDERAASRRGRRARLLGPEPPSQPRRARRRRGRDRCATSARSGSSTGAGATRRSTRRPRTSMCSSDDRVDAVVIATPVSTHFELAVAGAAVRQARVRREAARGELGGGRRADPPRPPRRPRADAGPHVPLQPAGRAHQGADRRRASSGSSTSSPRAASTSGCTSPT